MPKTDVDLLIAVYDAERVMQSAPGVRASIGSACAERRARPVMAVGVSPVGDRHKAAETVLQRWTSDVPPGGSFYIEGALDERALRGVLARFIYLVIGRNPRLNEATWGVAASPFGTKSYLGSLDDGGAL